MRSARITRLTTTAALALLAGLLFGHPVGASPLIEQSFQLEPGWNAIYLQVQPEPRDIATVFEGLPITSVWAWQPRTSPVTFLRDPGDGLLNQPGWLGFFPAGQHAFLTNLHTVQANRAYLVHYSGDAPMIWTVTGRPVLRSIAWTPSSFNLVGFPVDPQQPPTFAAYLSPSPDLAGQPIYRLNPVGQWEQVTSPQSARILPGEAYWVYAAGATGYTGPIQVEIDGANSLDYGSSLIEKGIRFRNLRGTAGTLTVRLLPSSQSVPLSYWSLEPVADPSGGGPDKVSTWQDLGNGHVISLRGLQESSLRLALRRALLGASSAEGILEITDGAGYRRLIAVSAESATGVPETAGMEGSMSPPGGEAIQAQTYEGLWIGSVSVDAVSEHWDPNGPTAPKPTGSPFAFRLMIHVSGAGEVKLLKQVTQMFDDDSLQPGGSTAATGKYVLVTEDAAIPQFEGVALRDGEPVGYRVSAVAYDFEGAALDMNASSGGFTPDGQLDCVLFLQANAPTNPFFHRYHPDHDEVYLDPNDYLDPNQPSESYEVTRSWTLHLDASDPAESPEWGSTLMTGTFAETIAGVHRDTITTQGTFRLRRVSYTADLSP